MATAGATGAARPERGERADGPGPWDYLLLALMVLIGSSTAPAARYAARELPVALLPLVRFGVAGLCVLPVAWRGGALGRLLRRDAAHLLITAALCVPINQAFFLNATRLAPTSHVALIYAACPLVVLALASALGQERPSAGRLIGVSASVSGVLVIGLDSLLRKAPAGTSPLAGDLLLVGAVGSWGAYLTASRPLIVRHGALPVLAGTFLAGAALQAPIALAMPPAAGAIRSASPAAWAGLAYLTLVVTVFGLACQNLAMRRLDASQVATVGNAAPVLTVFWGAWLFGEAITPALVVGGALTLGGILRATRPGRRAGAGGPPAEGAGLAPGRALAGRADAP